MTSTKTASREETFFWAPTPVLSPKLFMANVWVGSAGAGQAAPHSGSWLNLQGYNPPPSVT